MMPYSFRKRLLTIDSRLWTLALLFTFFTQAVFAAAPNPTAYPYEARLNAGPTQIAQVVETTLSNEILNLVREDFGNLQVLDDLNAAVPFSIWSHEARQVPELRAIELSSADERTPGGNLFDDNRLTEFGFDQKITADEPATILIDFGKIMHLHRFELWPVFGADIKGMELQYGLDRDNLKTLKRKTEFETLVDGDFPPLKWVKIALWGNDIKLSDINMFEREQATLYFTAEPGRRYRVVFGDMNLDNKRFTERLDEPGRADQQFTLAPHEFNPLAADDFDEDSVPNEVDNCPTLANKNQKDDDSDRIGDVCDNAVSVKNFSQSDVDNDGIGDIIDNCKLVPNPKQKEANKNGFGAACDNRYEGSALGDMVSKATGQSGSALPYGLIGGLLALLALGVIGFIAGKKKA